MQRLEARAPGLLDIDMDGQERIHNGTIDIGADESQGESGGGGGTWYTLDLTADPLYCAVNETSTVTATVTNPLTSSGVAGVRVNVSLDSGTLLSISNNGWHSQTAGYAYTDSSGQVTAAITRDTPGKVTVTATCWPSSIGEGPLSDSINVWFFFCSSESMSDWPMFMHDPQHTGMSETLDTAGETLTREWVVDLPTASTVRGWDWSVQIDEETVGHPNPAGGNTCIFAHPYIDSSPVVVNNKVVVGTWSGGYLTATGSVKAFNAANNGSTLWTFTTGSTTTIAMGGVASTPCISNGRVYVGTTNGYLYCLDLNTSNTSGSEIWARPTYDRTGGLSRIISSPVVHNGVVYITNEASKVYAFSADSSGDRIWSDEPNESNEYGPIELPIDEAGHGGMENGVEGNQQKICGASSPAIATVGENENTYLLVGSDDGYLYRIDLGELNYRSIAMLDMGGCVESSPSVSGNYAYIGLTIYRGRNLRRVIIEPFENAAYWELGEESRATTSLAYDYAYNGVDTGHIFYRLNALDPFGDPPKKDLPQYAIPQDYSPHWYFVGSAAHTTGGIVYTGNDNGRFYALDAQDLHSLVTDQGVDGYYDTGIQSSGFICSSPAIGYNVDANHNRWVFITTRSDGGKLYAFETDR